ncbi:glycosyltransferase family 39 protein [Curtobacterium ammoniigenes]|uniref:glycosyltransferase family 39 protein n=1 Tax=Curtobacterium ammoniigenes TaxID=395387 RepID=UPI00083188C4|nr:glycosyltransferase family 39 protein [Curtobacterium ammoniigenes]
MTAVGPHEPGRASAAFSRGVRRPLSAALIGVGAAAVTVLGSWIPSYWNDEAATLRLTRLPLGDFFGFVLEKDAVHALYALFMRLWIGRFGESELAVRAPSALAIGAAACGLFVLVGGFRGPRTATIAAVVFTVLPRVSFIGTEGRSFAIAVALVTWAAVSGVCAARRGDQLWRWGLFTAVTGVAIATFLYSALVIPAFIALVMHVAPADRRILRVAGASLLGAVTIASPVLLIAARQRNQISWLGTQPVTPWTVLVEPFFDQAWWLAALLISIALAACFRGRRAFGAHRGLVVALVLWLAVPAAALLIGTVLLSPMFTPRYLSIASPAVAFVAALALTRWRSRVTTALTIAITVAAAPSAIMMRTPVSKPAHVDLRSIARTIEREAHQGDAFLLSDTGTVSLRPRVAVGAYPAAFERVRDIALHRSYARTGTYSDVPVDSRVLDARLRRVTRVWVAVGDAGDRPLAERLARADLAPGRTVRVRGASLTLWRR